MSSHNLNKLKEKTRGSLKPLRMPPKKVTPQSLQIVTKAPENRFCSIITFVAGLAIGSLLVLVLAYAHLIPHTVDCETPVNGAWSEWSDWGNCTQSCGNTEKYETRIRTCTNPAPAHGGGTCVGEKIEVRECSTAYPCSGGEGWSLWEDWNECSSYCGEGNTTRQRTCKEVIPHRGNTICTRSDYETTSCIGDCKGTWGGWGEWSECDVTCGEGLTSRTRDCNSSIPGTESLVKCDGYDEEIIRCSNGDCPAGPVWGPWSKWNECSATCGNGIQSRERNCTSPNNESNGSNCTGMNLEERSCNLENCTVEGLWSEWDLWSECSVTCGNGIKSRSRICTDPKDIKGEEVVCVGNATDQQTCSLTACPLTCPTNYELVGTQCFQYKGVATDYLGAQEVCQRGGKGLARLDNTEIVAAVSAWITIAFGGVIDNFPDFWISGIDIDQDLKFFHQDGTEITWFYWGQNEPNGVQDIPTCIQVMGIQDFRWYDTDCFAQYPYVCEADPI